MDIYIKTIILVGSLTSWSSRKKKKKDMKNSDNEKKEIKDS